jgi:hypothetical protein
MLGIGLTMGLLVGGGMVIGVLVATGGGNSARLELPETLLHATATHGGETMAMATGIIDEGVEGLFVLDFITGELQCSVINPRTGQVGGLYRHNVVNDLGVTKNPKYLMVTGAANFRYGGGNYKPADCVVYIADQNTGRYVAYMLPWNRAAMQWGLGQVQPMVLLGAGVARQVEIE